MKILISIFLGFSLISAVSIAAPAKRKIAQKVECVPLGVPFDAFNEGEDGAYTAEELKMLRNSIYAQLGFQFKSQAVAAEMSKRGCLLGDAKYTADRLQKVDKKNASLLKTMEKSLRESDQSSDFQGQWEKAAKSRSSRAKMLSENYCYLSDAKGTYFGILYFGAAKTSGAAQLNGMMNIAKPTWAEPMTAAEREGYLSNIKYKELDTTSAVVLDFATKGTWSIVDDKVQLTINSDHKKLNDAVVTISAPNYKETRMLECKLSP